MLRTKKRSTERGKICQKCLIITPDLFAAQIATRQKENSNMPRKPKTVEDDLDDLDLDDLDELEDVEVEVEEEDEDVEVEEDDDEVEEDEDPDEAPKARKRKSKTAKAKAPKKEKTGIGTVELAAEAGVEPRTLRAYLRSSQYQPREEREGRYSWPSLRDPEAREIIKAVKGGAAAQVNKEKLAELKASKSSKPKATKTTSSKKKATARKRTSASK